MKSPTFGGRVNWIKPTVGWSAVAITAAIFSLARSPVKMLPWNDGRNQQKFPEILFDSFQLNFIGKWWMKSFSGNQPQTSAHVWRCWALKAVPRCRCCADALSFIRTRVRLIHFPAAGRTIRSDDNENPWAAHRKFSSNNNDLFAFGGRPFVFSAGHFRLIVVTHHVIRSGGFHF